MMSDATPGATTASGVQGLPSLPALIAAVALLCAGLATARPAGQRDGDFVHLWLGGHALVTEGSGAIYAPSTHRQLLDSTFKGAPPSELWAARNDTLGAFFYPPPAALAYAPLGALPLRVAATLHAVLAWLGAAAAGSLIGQSTGLGRVAGVAIGLSTPALFHNHVLGQNGGWVLLIIAIASVFWVRRPLLAGALLGLLVAKPSWLLATAWVPLLLGRWRILGALITSAIALSTTSAAVVGMQPWNDWLAIAPRLAALSTQGDYPLHLQYSLFGLARRVTGLGLQADLLGIMLGIGVVGLTGWAAHRTKATATRLALAWSAATLVNPHLHPYDVTGGIFAVAVLLAEPRHRRLGAVALLLHHGGQLLEGFQGSGWMLAPATMGLLFAWGAVVFTTLRPAGPSAQRNGR